MLGGGLQTSAGCREQHHGEILLEVVLPPLGSLVRRWELGETLGGAAQGRSGNSRSGGDAAAALQENTHPPSPRGDKCCLFAARAAPGVSALPSRGQLTWLTWELGSVTAVPGHPLCPPGGLRELRCPMEGGSPWAGGVPGAQRGVCTLCRGSWCSRTPPGALILR